MTSPIPYPRSMGDDAVATLAALSTLSQTSLYLPGDALANPHCAPGLFYTGAGF